MILVNIFYRVAVLWSVSLDLDPPFFFFFFFSCASRPLCGMSCHYRWVSGSFGSKISFSDGVALWDESVSACVW